MKRRKKGDNEHRVGFRRVREGGCPERQQITVGTVTREGFSKEDVP